MVGREDDAATVSSADSSCSPPPGSEDLLSEDLPLCPTPGPSQGVSAQQEAAAPGAVRGKGSGLITDCDINPRPAAGIGGPEASRRLPAVPTGVLDCLVLVQSRVAYMHREPLVCGRRAKHKDN